MSWMLFLAISWLFPQSPTLNEMSMAEIPVDQPTVYTSVQDIPPPPNCQRIELKENSFGHYLRTFPFNTKDNNVYYYNGQVKPDHGSYLAVLDLDIGSGDLQQCADAVMRLRAEYLYKQNRHDEISFLFVNGKTCSWKAYNKGDRSYAKFRKYLNYVFSYANTASLKKQLKPVADEVGDIQPGDVFIQSGNPYGHAITVMDVAVDKTTGERMFLLAQSFMPAQSVHLLVNPRDGELSPWYSANYAETLITPDWLFYRGDLRRF